MAKEKTPWGITPRSVAELLLVLSKFLIMGVLFILTWLPFKILSWVKRPGNGSIAVVILLNVVIFGFLIWGFGGFIIDIVLAYLSPLFSGDIVGFLILVAITALFSGATWFFIWFK